MKKQIYILNLLIILFAFSCKQNSSEKELNGHWREIENEYSTWHFYPDSIVFKFSGITQKKTEWKANKSQIRLEIPTFDRNSMGEFVDTINKVSIDYKLSSKKDSLIGTINSNYGKHKLNLLRTKSYSEYLHKKFGIEFTLPKTDSAELVKLDPIHGMKIFMYIENNKIKGKTELSNSLNNLESDIISFREKLQTYYGPKDWRNLKFYLSVYADNNIPDSTITKSLAITTKSNFFINNDFPRPPKNHSHPMKIYRMYENETIEFRAKFNGKTIKSIANTVY